MKHVCVYHRGDLDGKCGAAIYAHAMRQLYKSDLTSEGQPWYLWGVEYGDDINLDLLNNSNLVVIDWSFQPWSLFEEVLHRAHQVTWIDHHKSAIQDYLSAEHKDSWCPLITVLSEDFAACELAWKYFFPDAPMPEAVRLLGRYDMWDHRDPYCVPFQYYMRAQDNRLLEPVSDFWRQLLIGAIDIKSVVNIGELVMQYKEKCDDEIAANWFPVKLGGLNWQACNSLVGNSQLFDSVRDGDNYHGVMIFGWTGKHWRVRLYSARPDVDCSVIAKEYGGGGHRGAAGFSCEQLPFSLVSS